MSDTAHQIDAVWFTLGQLIAVVGLASSPTACQLLQNMPYGTYRNGTRYLSETDSDAAFSLLDDQYLNTHQIG